MKKKKNYFTYSPKENIIISGDFNIYFAKNGSIQLVMGNDNIALTGEQICQLHLDVYGLEDFDHTKFNEYYKFSKGFFNR